jgi:hypothetical protein
VKRALLAALLAGCGAPPAQFLAVQAQPSLPPAYEKALDTWTRGGQSYEAFVGNVFARATWFSPAFTAAFTDRESELLGLPPAEAGARREEAVKKAEGETRFFLALNTRDPHWADLARPDATMRVVLRDGDHEIQPLLIQPVSDTQQADLFPLLPYVGQLTTAWWITFPRAPDPKHVTLRLAGTPALVDLVWEVR